MTSRAPCHVAAARAPARALSRTSSRRIPPLAPSSAPAARRLAARAAGGHALDPQPPRAVVLADHGLGDRRRVLLRGAAAGVAAARAEADGPGYRRPQVFAQVVADRAAWRRTPTAPGRKEAQSQPTSPARACRCWRSRSATAKWTLCARWGSK